MDNTNQHNSIACSNAVLTLLNPQLKQLLGDTDCKEVPPMLFGENFGSLAKERLEAAAVALTKTLQTNKGFHKSHPQKYRSRGGGRHYSSSYSKQKGWQLLGDKTNPKYQQSRKWLFTNNREHDLPLCIVNNSLNAVTSTQVKGQAHYIQALINTMKLSINCPKLAGCVAHFLQNWKVPLGNLNRGWVPTH